MIGQTVSHYRILEKLGAGGMGVVYKAEDLSLQRFVALKFLPPESAASDSDRSRLVHEARAAALLLHPHICPVYEIGESEGRTFIAMAFLEGRSLRDRLSDGPLPVDEALKMAREIGEALSAAHERGIIHRDVKPDNVMVTPEGRAVLMDFGLARMSGATKLTRSGTTVGTAAYMSPEQIQGRDVDALTDIWALGVMLYEMASGELPFQAEYEPALAYAIANQEPKALSGSEIPPGLPGVIAKSLAKSASDRYATAREFVADVDELLRDRQSMPAGRVRRSSALARTWKRWRPWERVAVMSATAMAVAALIWGSVAFWPGRGEAINSIAVLPLQNLSNDPEQEYFVDGMTDELIGQLGKVHALTVISRTSSMRYKDTEKSVSEIAHDLNVDAVVEGSVRRDGDRVRISIDLVNARTDKSMWSDAYDMTMAGVFAVQTEVAAQVVQALRTTLAPEERDRLQEVPPANPEAYQLYLKGNFFLKRTEDEIRKAIQYFLQAVDLDPTYAAAYVGLARAYYSLPFYGYVRPDEAYPEARRYALKGLELDGSSAEAHATLAFLSTNEWQWETGEREFKRAIELGPNRAGTRNGYAFFLLYMNRTDEAVVQERRAVELDPLNVALRQNLGEVLYFARRYDESIRASLETIDMDPMFPQTNMFLGMAYAAKGMTEEAVKALDRDSEISGGKRPEVESWIGVAYALAGQKDRARQVYTDMLGQSQSKFIAPFRLACICFVLGDVDRGFEWLAEGYEQHDPSMSFLKVHPACDAVRNDPRYPQWLKKMGLDS